MRLSPTEERFSNRVYDFVREAVWAGIPATTLRAMIAESYRIVCEEEGRRGAEVFTKP